MPRLAQSVPKYRKHKASGQAFVELNGQRQYLGPHGSRTSRDEYDRLIGEWLQNGRTAKSTNAESGALLVVELIAGYLNFAKSYYRKGGQLTSEYAAILHAVLPLKQLYGRKRVDEFGPIALQAVMARMVANGWARTTVNRQVRRIKRLFKWGVSQELIPASIYHALSTVSGLRKGRTEAHETDPVLPVADTVVDTTLVHLPEVVADMVRFQRLTGCRPEEVCAVRPCDVDRSNDIWQYRPQSHKTEHLNRERVILIGPQAQAVLFKYLARNDQMYCFRPMDSEVKRRAAAHAARVLHRCRMAIGRARTASPSRIAGRVADTA